MLAGGATVPYPLCCTAKLVLTRVRFTDCPFFALLVMSILLFVGAKALKFIVRRRVGAAGS